MIIKSLGHAGLFVQLGSSKILMDPWLSNEILGVCRRFPDPGSLKFEIPHPDYLILSHHHWDHVHIPTLQALDKKTPVFIPDNDQLKRILNLLNFHDIRVLEPWDKTVIDTNLQFIATPSKVPFGEMGICFLDGNNYLLNLVDSVFDSKILRYLREMLTEIDSNPYGVCLSPYQSYDEMSTLMRQTSTSKGVLSRQNAESLKELGCDLIIPFADGLYYPGNELMNQLTFLNHPYDFIDEIKNVNPDQACMIGLVLDEWYISKNQFKFSRSIPLDAVEILNLYDQLRSVKNYKMTPIQSVAEDALYFNDCKKEWARFVKEFSIIDIPTEVLSKFKSLGMCWELIVLSESEEDNVFIKIDFQNLRIQSDLSILDCNSYLKIGSALLLQLLRSEELLSIAIQSDRIELGGSNRELAYRSLDVLWYMGLDDKSRLESYVLAQSEKDLALQIAQNWT